MPRVWKDIAFQAGKYTDREGKEKTRYQPGGKLVIEDDGRMWGIIEFMGQSCTFSVFDQKQRDGEPERGQGGASRDSAVRESSTKQRAPIDDDIPF